MDDKRKPLGVDVSGYEVLQEAVRELLNQFPGLMEGESIKFEELEEKEGICFSNDAGALIYNRKKDVIGIIHEVCEYSFFVVYRSAASAKEAQKLRIANFLDALGKWLCGETAVIDGRECKLSSYPKLAQGRKIEEITRNLYYATEPQENGVQDWLLPVTIQYKNDYKKGRLA